MGKRYALHVADENGVSTGEVVWFDDRTLAEAQADALARLQQLYTDTIAAGLVVTVQGQARCYQIDAASQGLISGAVVDAMLAEQYGGWPADFFWITADNTPQPMTAADCIAFGRAVKAYIAAIIWARRAAKDAIAALQSNAECDGFDVIAGWPSNP